MIWCLSQVHQVVFLYSKSKDDLLLYLRGISVWFWYVEKGLGDTLNGKLDCDYTHCTIQVPLFLFNIYVCVLDCKTNWHELGESTAQGQCTFFYFYFLTEIVLHFI